MVRIANGVVVLNASMEPLGIVPLHRALIFLIRERATIVDAVPGRIVRSAEAEFPMPRVVQFREKVRVPYRYGTVPWSRAGLLRRDDHECAYCGRHATTVDHVMPRSRGGQDEWLNTVAACNRCNNVKADRTRRGTHDAPLRAPRGHTPRHDDPGDRSDRHRPRGHRTGMTRSRPHRRDRVCDSHDHHDIDVTGRHPLGRSVRE